MREDTMTRLLRLSFLFAVLAVNPAAAQTLAPAREQATLAPGDSVRIAVWRRPELSGDFVVGPDGSVTHPLLRTVKVGGVPQSTAEANVRSFLLRFDQDPQFVLEPLFRIAVTGEVNRPALFAANPQMSILEAIARAGGPTNNAARNRVRLLRYGPQGEQKEFVIDMTRTEGGVGRSPIHSGDQIIVDRRKSFFRDILIPTLGVVGSVASIALLIDRTSRN
jgi:protein involved in polysaccharide export with SLBB domain